jgi:hypothetical protein
MKAFKLSMQTALSYFRHNLKRQCESAVKKYLYC